MLLPDIFKGWTKPGPRPVGGPAPEAGETLDPLSGHWGIYQYEGGHRYSTDDLLTAWYGSSWSPSPQKILDLGSGISSIGMMVAWKLPGSRITTIEAQSRSVKLAKKSLAYNGIEDRFRVIEGDLRDKTLLEESEKFDLILACPPYWPPGAATEAQHPQAVRARIETRGDINDYCMTVARHLGLGAAFCLTFPYNQLDRIKNAASNAGLGIIRQRPVLFKEDKAESLGLFIMVLKTHVPNNLWENPWIEPPLVIRLSDGKSHPEYAAIKLAMGFPPW